ncbi:MAG: T9SS type A sorting domain-containing protein [Vicingus serpentipes]|nr:T9SS type A sorting domain-containing protein [Vicingus serpentipes]
MLRFFQIALLLLPIVGFSQKDTLAHLYMFGGSDNDNAEDVAATSDGGYIVVGSTSSNSYGNTDVYLLKVDSLCDYQWSFALGGANNDWGYSVKQTYDKGFIIAASSNSYGNGGYDAVLMKRDSVGKYQWTRSYGGDDWDFAYSVVQAYDSGYVFCGETYNNSNGQSDVYVVKTNPLGDTLWTKTIGGSLIDKGSSVIETSDSNIVVAGLRNTLTDSTQAYLIKLSSSGILLWDSLYGGAGYEEIKGINETSDGGFISIGIATNIGVDKDYYALRTNKDGVKVWGNMYGNPGDEVGYDIAELMNGDFLAVGYTAAAGAGEKDGVYFKIHSAGWWLEGGTFGGILKDNLKKISIGNNNQMVFAGATNSYGNGKEDVLLIRLDTLYPSMDTAIVLFQDTMPLSSGKKNEKSTKLFVFPNPVKSQFYLKIMEIGELGFVDMMITDVSGRVVYSQAIYQPQTKIDISQVSSGVYFLVIKSKGENMYWNQKIIKINNF